MVLGLPKIVPKDALGLCLVNDPGDIHAAKDPQRPIPEANDVDPVSARDTADSEAVAGGVLQEVRSFCQDGALRPIMCPSSQEPHHPLADYRDASQGSRAAVNDFNQRRPQNTEHTRRDVTVRVLPERSSLAHRCREGEGARVRALRPRSQRTILGDAGDWRRASYRRHSHTRPLRPGNALSRAPTARPPGLRERPREMYRPPRARGLTLGADPWATEPSLSRAQPACERHSRAPQFAAPTPERVRERHPGDPLPRHLEMDARPGVPEVAIAIFGGELDPVPRTRCVMLAVVPSFARV